MDYREIEYFDIRRDQSMANAVHEQLEIDYAEKETLKTETMCEFLICNLNTVNSMQEIIRDVQRGPYMDFHMGDGEDAFRAWVRSLRAHGETYNSVRESIEDRFLGDRIECYRHHSIHNEMIREATQFMMYSPPPHVNMSVDEIHRWISHACLVSAYDVVFDEYMSIARKRITVQMEMYGGYIQSLKRKTDRKKHALAYEQHLYGYGEGANKESMVTLIIKNTYDRIADGSKYTRIKSPLLWIHHVRRANGAGCKMYARCYDAQRLFTGSTGWFTLRNPEQHLHFMHLSCMPANNIMKACPLALTRKTITITYITSRLNQHHFRFRACTLEQDGPLPQTLRRFLPQQPSADDYTLMEGAEAAALYQRQTHEIYKQLANNLLHERELYDPPSDREDYDDDDGDIYYGKDSDDSEYDDYY